MAPWIDSEFYIANEDLKQFTDRGIEGDEFKEKYGKLCSKYPVPLSNNKELDWDAELGAVPEDKPTEENTDPDKQSPPSAPDLGKNEDKGKHGKPE